MSDTDYMNPALFADILRARDDDGLRLAYADWLESKGVPDYAEFIRLQCLLAKTQETDDEYFELLPRTIALQWAHDDEVSSAGSRWSRRLAELAGTRMLPGIEFRRGLVEQLELEQVEAESLFKAGDAVVETAPALVGLTVEEVTKPDSLLLSMTTSKFARELTSIRFQDADFGDDGMRLLSNLPLSRLNRLEFEACDFGDDGLRLLSSSELIHTVAHLDITYYTLDDKEALPPSAASLTPLLESPNQPPLESLILVGYEIHQSTVACWSRLPRLSKLRTLELRKCRIEPDALAEIAGAEWLSGVESLDLSGSVDCGSSNFAGIDWSNLVGLRRLRFCGNKLSAAEAPRLIGPSAPNLVSLDLGENALGDNGAESLAKIDFSALRSLDVAECKIGKRGMAALAQSDTLRELRYLKASCNPIGQEGAAAIAGGNFAESLRAAVIWQCGIRAGGAKTIATAPALENLRWLSIDDNDIGVEGGQAILDSPCLNRLTALRIRDGNGFERDDTLKLEQRFAPGVVKRHSFLV